jgi:hypothetical protein
VPKWLTSGAWLAAAALAVTACESTGTTTSTLDVAPTFPPVATTSSTVTTASTTTATPVPGPPQLSDGWFIGSREILVTGASGLTAYNPDTGETRAIATTAVARAYTDGMAGLVLQDTAPGDGEMILLSGASSAEIWYYPVASDDPALVHAPSLGSKSELYGVVDFGEGPAALIRLHAYQNDDLWVIQPLDGSAWREIGFLSGGEDVASCAVWTGSNFLLSSNAHASFISRRSVDGMWSAFLPAEEEGWEFATSCVALGADGRAVVLLQQWDESGDHPPAELIIADLDQMVVGAVTIDDAVKEAVFLDAARDGSVVVATVAGDLFLIDSSTGAATLLPIQGHRAVFVP